MITHCAICNSPLTEEGKCSEILCYAEHEFHASSYFADFYLDKYTVEYHYTSSGTFNRGTVFINGELKSLHSFDEPLDFSNDPINLIKRIESLQTFK